MGLTCGYCGRSLPEKHAILDGQPCCVNCWTEGEVECARCRRELTKAEAWIGDVCARCIPFTREEARVIRAAGGSLP